MKIKLVESIYFPAPCPRLEPRSCQMVLSAPSPSQRVPLKEQWSFFPDTPCPAPGKDDEARRTGGQGLPPARDEWQDGESARAPVVSGVVKACGRQPGKFRYTHPVIDYSAASQKDTAGRGLTTIVSFCCLWGWEPGKYGAEMLPSGDGGKKSPGQWNLLKPIVRVFVSLHPVSFSLRWVVVGNRTWGEGREPLMNGWRRGKDKRRHCGQMELSGA